MSVSAQNLLKYNTEPSLIPANLIDESGRALKQPFWRGCGTANAYLVIGTEPLPLDL